MFARKAGNLPLSTRTCPLLQVDHKPKSATTIEARPATRIERLAREREKELERPAVFFNFFLFNFNYLTKKIT
jgi:hypothetical protein